MKLKDLGLTKQDIKDKVSKYMIDTYERFDFLAYSELVKSFERIRSYMREFYVYGFKSREEYGIKSARSYDNERRRIPCPACSCWLL